MLPNYKEFETHKEIWTLLDAGHIRFGVVGGSVWYYKFYPWATVWMPCPQRLGVYYGYGSSTVWYPHADSYVNAERFRVHDLRPVAIYHVNLRLKEILFYEGEVND